MRPLDFQCARPEKLVARSRERFGASREKVNIQIKRWLLAN